MTSPHILLVEARFYEGINDALVEGATTALREGGASFDHIVVPGALEIPAAIAIAVNKGRTAYDGFVGLGVVIRGETYHFELVSNEAGRGLSELAIRHSLAIGNGVITVENERQAWSRALRDKKDKGGDAARAALMMINVKTRLKTGLSE